MVKVILRLAIVISLAATVALPGVSSAQSVCKGIATIVEAIGSRSEDEVLELYSLPNATCELDTLSEFVCDWSRPRPPGEFRSAAVQAWYRGVMNEAKTLAREIQNCIVREEIPHNWKPFRTEKEDGTIYGYYAYTDGKPRKSIVVCASEDNYDFPRGERHLGASLRLVVLRGHRNFCFSL